MAPGITAATVPAMKTNFRIFKINLTAFAGRFAGISCELAALPRKKVP
jgi:hypothetical protein